MSSLASLIVTSPHEIENLRGVQLASELVQRVRDLCSNKASEELCDLEAGWEAIHLSLTSGQLSDYGGTYPLNLALLGGEKLYGADDFWLLWVSPEHAMAVANAVVEITWEDFRAMYKAIDPELYSGTRSSDDFVYSWSLTQALIDLYISAAKAKRGVVVFITPEFTSVAGEVSDRAYAFEAKRAGRNGLAPIENTVIVAKNRKRR